MRKGKPDDTDPVDVAALERALAACRAGEPMRRGQLEAMIQEGGWRSAGRAAAYGLQIKNLHLKPHQLPPCVIDENNPRSDEEASAAMLLRRMISLGLSRYEPDPLAAIEAAEARAGSPPMKENDAPARRQPPPEAA
jgi:hypothetical protein